MSRLLALVVLTVALTAAAGCGSTTAPEPIDLTSTAEIFVGPVDPGGSTFFEFQTTRTEYVRVTLLRLDTGDPFAPLNAPLSIQLGQVEGEACVPFVSVSGAPQFQAQLARVLGTGRYCAAVVDEGTLTQTVSAILRVVHPPPTGGVNPASTSSGSNIVPGGQASLLFTASGPGTVTVTLRDLSASKAGLGVGIAAENTVDCLLSRTMEVSPQTTPHFSLPADPGSYCVTVYDPGTFEDLTYYLVEVSHP